MLFLLEEMGQIFWIIDADSQRVRYASVAAQTMGANRLIEIGEKTFSVLPEPVASQLSAEFEQHRQEYLSQYTKKYTTEISHFNADGAEIYVEFEFCFYFSPITRKTEAIVTARDITARRKDEAALIASEKRFSTIFYHSPIGMCITDQETKRFIDINESMLQMLGYSREDLVGKSYEDPFIRLDLSDEDRIREDLTSQGRAIGISAATKRKDGKNLDVMLFSENILLGDEIRNVTQVIDVTEHHLVQEALVASERQFTLIANTIDEVFWMYSIKRKEFVYVSPAFERIAGVSIAEVFTAPADLVRYIHPADLEIIAQAFHGPLDGKVADVELRIIPANTQTPRWIRVRGYSVYGAKNEEAEYFIGTGEDIHETKLAQLQLQQREHNLQMRTEELSRLLSAGREMRRQMSPQEIYDTLYRHIKESIPCDMMLVADYERASQRITPQYVRIRDRLLSAGNLPAGNLPAGSLPANCDGLHRKLFTEGQPLMTNALADIWVERCASCGLNTFFSLAEKASPSMGETASVIGLPLLAEGKVSGMLQVYSVNENAYTDNHLRFLESLVLHATSALEVSRLVSELEERVRARTAEVEDLYENAPAGYYSLDREGRITRINQTGLRWLGYHRHEIIYRPMSAILTPDSAPKFAQAFESLQRDGWLYDLELDCLCKDGASMPVIINASAICDSDGSYQSCRATMIDHSEIKASREALRQTAERLNLATRSAGIGIWDWDIVNQTMVWDDHTAEKWGFSRHSHLDMNGTLDFIVHPEDRVRFIEKYHQAIDENGSMEVELMINTVKYGLRWLNIFGEVFRDASNTPTRMLGVFYDVTNRKQYEQLMRESEQQNRLLFEESPTAITLLNEEGYIVRTNHAFANLVTSGDDLADLSQAAQQLDHGVDTYLLPVYRSLRESGNVFAAIEHEIQRPDGSVINVQNRAYAMEIGGAKHYLITTNNITEHKRAEEALRLGNMELERAMRMKDEFLANMSHELRTPLNAIIGISDSLEDKVAGALTERQMLYVRTINESAHHLLNLINDILDLSKIGAGKMQMEMSNVPIEPLAQTCLRMVREMALKKNIRLSYENDGLVTDIYMDERRIKQALVNLLINGIKFTKPGGRVGLEISGDLEAGTASIVIWDTGVGISKSDVSKLFQPFVQLDAGLDREHEGTGLGLALVSQIARIHSGSISLDSTPGVGSRFTVQLPWSPASMSMSDPLWPEEIEEDLQAEMPLATGKVLLVEDTAATVLFVRDYLEHAGYEVQVANDGLEAIKMARVFLPDLILMDIQMRGIDGIKATSMIRDIPAMKNTPIIAMTALAMPGDRERCLAAGMTDYVSKPISPHRLILLISKKIGNRKQTP